MAEHLNQEQIEAKAAELSESLKTAVFPLVFVDVNTNEQIIGYMKNPPRIAKMRALDKAIQSPSEAGEMMLQASLIREHSDPRITSDKPENDEIYMGACIAALSRVRVLQDIYKKK